MKVLNLDAWLGAGSGSEVPALIFFLVAFGAWTLVLATFGLLHKQNIGVKENVFYNLGVGGMPTILGVHFWGLGGA